MTRGLCVGGETEPVAARRRRPRPVPDTPSGLSSSVPRKFLETGLYGMGRGWTRWYDRLSKAGSDLHV